MGITADSTITETTTNITMNSIVISTFAATVLLCLVSTTLAMPDHPHHGGHHPTAYADVPPSTATNMVSLTPKAETNLVNQKPVMVMLPLAHTTLLFPMAEHRRWFTPSPVTPVTSLM